MRLSQSPNAIRLRARREAIRSGLPIPNLTHEERKQRQHRDPAGRARKGWETRTHPERRMVITEEDRARCIRIWMEKNPYTPVPDWWRPEEKSDGIETNP